MDQDPLQALELRAQTRDLLQKLGVVNWDDLHQRPVLEGLYSGLTAHGRSEDHIQELLRRLTHDELLFEALKEGRVYPAPLTITVEAAGQRRSVPMPRTATLGDLRRQLGPQATLTLNAESLQGLPDEVPLRNLVFPQDVVHLYSEEAPSPAPVDLALQVRMQTLEATIARLEEQLSQAKQELGRLRLQEERQKP